MSAPAFAVRFVGAAGLALAFFVMPACQPASHDPPPTLERTPAMVSGVGADQSREMRASTTSSQQLLDAVNSTQFELDPPVHIRDYYGGLSGASDYQPRAASNGSIFLIGWLSHGEGWIERVSSAGKVLDQFPKSVRALSGSGTYQPYSVDVASNGSGWLVAWAGAGASDYQVRARRLDANGTYLDATPFTIAASSTNGPAYPRVASSGDGFLVVWAAVGGSGAWDLRAARVAADGTVLDPGGFVIASSIGSDPPDVVWAAGEYLVTWLDCSSLSGPCVISASRISADGTVLDPSAIVVGTGDPRKPTVTSDGSTFLVAWVDYSTSQLAMSRVSPAGAVLDTPTLKIVIDGDGYGVAGDSAGFVASWWDGQASTVMRRLDSSLGFLDASPVVAMAGYGQVVVAADGSHRLIARVGSPTATSPNSLDAVATDSSGLIVAGPEPISTILNNEYPLSVVANGPAYLAVWTDDQDLGTGGYYHIHASRFDANGSVLGDAGFLVSGEADSQASASVTPLGTGYLVAWTESFSYQAAFARVGIDGTVLDQSKIVIAGSTVESATPIVTATDGSDALVVWQRPSDGTFGAARIAPDGSVLDIADAADLKTFYTGVRASLTWAGSYYLFAYECGNGSICVNKLGQDGAVQVRSAYENGSHPQVAYNGTQSLLVWTDNSGNVRATRLSATGEALDDPGVLITGIDHVDEFLAADGPVYALLVDHSKLLMIDATGVPTARDAAPGWTDQQGIARAIAVNTSGTLAILVQSQTFYPQVPAAMESRAVVELATVRDPQGAACQVGQTCLSGFCADNVCCDTSCGGNVMSDCQACAMSRGATADGTCTILPAGTTCRAALDECDQAETCDGVGLRCPDNAHAADGTPCTPDKCSTSATCQAGTCTSDAPVDCPAPAECRVGTCDLTSGCTIVPAPDGTPCSTGSCLRGTCSANGAKDGAGGCGCSTGSSGGPTAVLGLLVALALWPTRWRRRR